MTKHNAIKMSGGVEI